MLGRLHAARLLLAALTGQQQPAAAACVALLQGPVAGEACRPQSSLASTQIAISQAPEVDDEWWQEVRGGGGGGGAEEAALFAGQDQMPQRGSGRPRHSYRLEAPIDAPRSLRDYQKMVYFLSRRKR